MGITEQETSMDSSDKLASVLKCANSSYEDRLNVYKTLASKLRTEEDDAPPDFIRNCKLAINLALTDTCDKFPELSQGSLQFLGLCIHNRLIVDTLSPKESESIVQGLCKCILNTEDKAICTRALWCLSNQIVHLEVLNSQLSNIIDSLDYSFSKPLSQSVLVEHEAVSVVIRLLQQMPKKMQESASCWSHHVYGLLGHGAVKVREKALQALTLALPALLQNPNGLIPSMVADVKAKMANELKKLFNNRNEVYVLRVWSLLVQLLGKELHCVFINQLLPIVELGFKSSIPNIKYEAFSAWKYLIENFASNPAIIGDQKRIKLLMQVFKINNAKTETVAMKKLEVWWYFVKKLDTKILSNFDMVCTPLLRFCVGGKWTQGSRNTPTPKPGNTPLTLSSQGTVWPSFAPLQEKGLEVIANLLKLPPGSVNLPAVELELDALNDNVVLGPALFLKQSSIIAYATVELMCSVEASDDLVLYIWCLLVEHMRLGLEAGLKVDCRDALSSFLCDFSTLVLSRQAPYSVKYKLFLAVSKLPKKILCSTAYNISSGEKIHGTPALFLTELLLTPSMLEEGIFQENYVTLFGTLIEMGMANPSGALEFCQAVIQVLDRHAGFVQQTEQLFKLWLCIACPLSEHITKNNEVNQGDALEHNFTSLYRTLFFSVKWLFGNCLSQTNIKSLLKIWSNMYRRFANLAALVVNASANVTCEHISHLILEGLSELEERLEDLVFVECLAQLCEVVLSCVNFSSHGENSAFALNSPGKWSGKRKQKPLKNLHSFVTLLAKVTSACHKHMTVTENNNVSTPEKQPTSTTVQSTAKCLVGVLTTLFTGITTSNYVSPVLEKCAGPVSGLFAVSNKANSKINPKIEKLWQDIIYCSQNVYTGMYDSDFLLIMAPLLEVNFMHTRRLIKRQTVQFWNATFGRSVSLTYPESLRLVLSKANEKVMIMLPSWISTEIQIIEETPTSQFSEASSQVADEIPVPIMLSPSKMHGSMLKNIVPPSPLSSFVVKPKPVKDYSACKKQSLSELKDKDFVVIDSPQNKCRILTQHQQEVLRERKFSVPAMYNSLDQSQDSVVFSNSINSSQLSSRSNDTFTEVLENKKSNVENTVKSKKKVNFLDQSNQLNIITNSFSKQDIVKEFALTAQENIAVKLKIQKEMVTKVLQNPVNIQSIKTKDTKALTSPATIKNTPDSTPLQNWLSTSHSKSYESSKNSISLEPHMSSLIEDSVSTFDSPASNKVFQSLSLATEAISQKNLSFVEETQSPTKVSPDKKVSAESILETPVKMPIKINHNFVNTRQLSFDDVEEITTKSSESPTQDEMSPCENTIEPFTAVSSKHDGLQIVVDESEPFDNSLQNVLPFSNSDTISCNALRQNTEDPLAENIPMDAGDLHADSVSKDNSRVKKQSQKRKVSTTPDPPGTKRRKLCLSVDNSSVDNCVEVVKSLNSSDDYLDETLDTSINVSSNFGTDDSKLHSNDSHEENFPPRKRLTGSKKRKPLKVTKLTPTSPNRRISPVKTRSWGKVLRTRRKAVRTTDIMVKRHKKSKNAKNSSEIADPTLIALNRHNTTSVTVHNVLDNSYEKSTKVENSTELSPMKTDLDLKPLKSEEIIDSVNESMVEKDKLISSDHNSLQVESFDSSLDVSVKSDSASDFAIEEKTVGDSSQDSISSDENVNSESLAKRENLSPNSLVAGTPKKSLRLRSGTRGFPSKFSDSFVYGIKKSLAQKSVMKTSPPQKYVQLAPKDTLISNKVESNILAQPFTKEKIAVDKWEESKNKEQLVANKDTFVCYDQVELNNVQLVNKDNVVVNGKADMTSVVQSVSNTDSVASNKVESNNVVESIADKDINDNKVESNVDEPAVTKDSGVSNKVESTMVKSITDEDNIANCGKIELQDVVQPIATKDCAMSDTEVVVQPFVNKDNSVSNKSMPENTAALVATPSTKPPPTCDTPDNVLPYSYSPSPVYSPTTGILKKRLVNGSGETPSPPNKQRRVSFADPIFEEKTLPSPVSQKRRLTPGSSKSSRRSLLTNYKKRDCNQLFTSNSPNGSQSSYSSSQESQLNCTNPIFPDLVNCQEPVGQILPQLTSSIWCRGLGQLLSAKKIHTIGDLASLSEFDIHNLPVRSPKVSNVKTVLTNSKQQQDAKKEKSANTSFSEMMAAVATATAAAAAHTASTIAAHTASTTSAHTASTTSAHTASTTSAHTASTTPAHTASTTPAHTASTTPAHTASTTPAHTASTTPAHTASTTPAHTASTTPAHTASTTAAHTASTTAAHTASTTAAHTASTTAAHTASTTAAHTASTTAAHTASTTAAHTASTTAAHTASTTAAHTASTTAAHTASTTAAHTASTTAAHTASTTAAHTASTTASCEPDIQSLKEKENKVNMNVKGLVAATENPKTKTPEKMETSLTAAADQLLIEENLPTEEKESFLQEMPELDTSSSVKSDDSTLEPEDAAASKDESNTPLSSEDATQSTITVFANSDNNLSSDLGTSIPVFENPEASSTPVKPATETKESDSNMPGKDESSHLIIENSSSGDLLCSIKPICLENKFSAIDCNMKDATDEPKDLRILIDDDEDDDDKDDYCTVEDDVKSILENSGALLEEVEKLSQSVQELERSPRSPKFIRKKYNPGSPELESTEGFDVDHLLPNMAEGNTKNVQCSVDSAVQKDLELLPTLKDLSAKFTEKEIQKLAGEEIQEAHECLQQLFSSVMKAVIPRSKRK